MAAREEEIRYGCFRCGHQIDALDDLIRPSSCPECGKEYLLTYQEALDILNDLYLKEKFKPIKIVDSDEESFIVDNQDA